MDYLDTNVPTIDVLRKHYGFKQPKRFSFYNWFIPGTMNGQMKVPQRRTPELSMRGDKEKLSKGLNQEYKIPTKLE